jgi:cystathionine beta-lyase/cystathionine gamma-synthase
MKDDKPRLGLKTRAVHSGENPDPVTRACAPNLVMSTNFRADADASFSVEGLEEDSPYFYTRWSNPTIRQLEQKLMELEEAEDCVVFASGMAAITALFLHLLRSGDRLLISDVSYAATAELTNDMLPRMGIEITRVNMSDLEEVSNAMSPEIKLVYVETPCNPILRLTDIEAVAEITHRAGAKLAVDSTFATPVATQPISLGADYVIHSLTKYLCGHGDAIGGALLGSRNELEGLRQKVAIRTGGIISPFNAWLIMRGMATLPIRMKAHESGAFRVASFLEAHSEAKKVLYPGLPSHPQHDLAKKQMKNFSGMLTFQLEGGAQAARTLADRLNIFHYAVSLGHHRSLVFYLPTEDLFESSYRLTAVQKKAYRDFAGDGVFRVSVGIEDPEDLCTDLEQVLSLLG